MAAVLSWVQIILILALLVAGGVYVGATQLPNATRQYLAVGMGVIVVSMLFVTVAKTVQDARREALKPPAPPSPPTTQQQPPVFVPPPQPPVYVPQQPIITTPPQQQPIIRPPPPRPVVPPTPAATPPIIIQPPATQPVVPPRPVTTPQPAIRLPTPPTRPPTPTPAPTPAPSGTNGVSALEQRVHDLVNKERTDRGLQPLVLDVPLSAVARQHSQDQLQNPRHHGCNIICHTGSDGSTPFDRMKRAGLNYRTAAENVAYNTSGSAEAAVRGWMNSSGHRANILNTAYTNSGVGIAQSGRKTIFTQKFRTPR